MSNLDEAVAAVIDGDTAAFQRIVEATSDRLVRLSARMMGNLADAEDVVQEAYLKAFRSLRGGKFDQRARVETWLYRIVTNASIDAMRSRTRRPEPTDQLWEGSWAGSDAAEAHLALVELDQWLRDLPPDQRAAIVLKAVEGFSSAEAAEILECSEGAVEQRLVRARATLRERSKQS